MSKVIAHGYIGLTAPDLGQWRHFGTDVLGAALGPGSTEELVQLRLDERAWRVWIEPGEGGYAFSGWEVANAAQLEALAKDLDAAGIAYKEDAALAQTRGVAGLIVSADPAGNQLEFYYGAGVPQEPFVSPLGVEFVTGDQTPGDLGFGHIGIYYPDYAEADHFYLDVLGFRVSDFVAPFGGRGDTFAHVNGRHHSIAYGQHPEGGSTFDHFMIQVATIDQVGEAYDRVADHGVEVVSTFGKHTNDRMTSFYIITPSGVAMEYGAGGRLVDDASWTTVKYDADSIWGHKIQGTYWGGAPE